MRRACLAAAVLLCLLACGCVRQQPWRPKLIVLLAIDTLRADHLACAGYDRPLSPSIDGMARDGVLFEHQYSQANQTVMSFPSIFTGLYPAENTQGGLTDARPTMASLLQAYGFETASFNGGGFLRPEFGFARGFDRYECGDFGYLRDSLPATFEWLGGVAAGNRRAFLFLHGWDTHMPYRKPLHFAEVWDPGYSGVGRKIAKRGDSVVLNHVYYPDAHGATDLGKTAIRLNAADEQYIRAAYDGSVAFADIAVGLFLSEIGRLGLTDDVLILLIGDHGEQLCEHGTLGHATLGAGAVLWHEEELHVPLIVWGAGGIPGGRRIQQLSEHVDLLPTVLDYAGIPLPDDLAGQSLRQVLAGTEMPNHPIAISVSLPTMSVRSQRYRYVSSPGQPDGLFDLEQDPSAQVNILEKPGMDKVVANLLQTFRRRYEGHHL